MTSVDLILIFCVDVHMGLDPPPPVHLSLTPLRVDVINGWPHRVRACSSLCKDSWNDLVRHPSGYHWTFGDTGFCKCPRLNETSQNLKLIRNVFLTMPLDTISPQKYTSTYT